DRQAAQPPLYCRPGATAAPRGSAVMEDRMTLAGSVERPRVSLKKRLEGMFGPDWKVGQLFVLPMVLIMALLIFWPFVNAIFISTTSFNCLTGETASVGLRNYERLWTNSDFLQSMQNTIVFTFWSLSLKFIVGMSVALILNSRLPFR